MTFCDPDAVDCGFEVFVFALPYYAFLIVFPFRYYEVKLVALVSPPSAWPISSLCKRLCCFALAGICTVAWNFILEEGEYEYLAYGFGLRAICYWLALWLMYIEYHRFLPQSWLGLRGLFVLGGFVDSFCRVVWGLFFHPMYLGEDATEFVDLLVMGFSLCLFIYGSFYPNDLPVDQLPYAQRVHLLSPVPSDEGAGLEFTREDNMPRRDNSGLAVTQEVQARLKVAITNQVMTNTESGTRVEYKMSVTCTFGDETQEQRVWSLRRRYNAFYELDQEINKVFTRMRYPAVHTRLPKLPPKDIFATKDRAWQNARRDGLNGYIQTLSDMPEVYVMKFFEFLNVPDDLQSVLLSTQQASLDNSNRGSYVNFDNFAIAADDSQTSVSDMAGTSSRHLDSSGTAIRVKIISHKLESEGNVSIQWNDVGGDIGTDGDHSGDSRSPSQSPKPSNATPRQSNAHPNLMSPAASPSRLRNFSMSPRARRQQPFVVYNIETYSPNNPQPFKTQRRYRDFIQFHKKLIEATCVSIPELPPKMRTDTGNRDWYFHESRRIRLEQWLDSIIKDAACRDTDVLWDFLNSPNPAIDDTTVLRSNSIGSLNPSSSTGNVHALTTYDVSIPAYEWAREEGTGKQYARYRLHVTRAIQGRPPRSRIVFRRYNEFEALHKILAQTSEMGGPLAMSVLPPLPSKGFLSALSPYLETRRVGLETYLKAILRDSDFGCPAVDEFLWPEDERAGSPRFPSQSVMHMTFSNV